MAEKGNGGTKLSTVLYFTCLTIAAAAFIFFLYLLLVDAGLFLFGYVFSPYTLAFSALALVFTLRTGALLKEKGGKVSYHGGLAAVGALVVFAAALYCGAADMKHSKTADMLVLNGGRNALLTEYSVKNGTTGQDNTYIDVHILYGRIAMKLGHIDETYFSNKCIESDLYAYAVNETDNVLTIECEYGKYGDGTFAIDPAHDTTTIKYDFKLR